MSKSKSTISLRSLLVILFMSQIILIVLLIGYFSYHNGQKAVENVSMQLREEVSLRIKEKTSNYAQTPHLVNEQNADIFAKYMMKHIKVDEVISHLWKQLQYFGKINQTYFGTAEGEYINVSRKKDKEGKEFFIVEIALPNSGKSQRYKLNTNGKKMDTPLGKNSDYDPRIRPWYEKGVEKKGWSPVYVDFNTGERVVTAVKPIFSAEKKKKVLGVLGSEFWFSETNEFLQQMKIGKTGVALLMDREGFLLSTSTDDPICEIKDVTIPQGVAMPDGSIKVEKITERKTEALLLKDSKNKLFQEISKTLQREFGGYKKDNIKNAISIEFKFNKERYFLQVSILKDEFGLDMLIIVVIPEKDFMAQIYKNNHTTMLISGLALLASLLIGAFAARRISAPISKLNIASQSISHGKWDQTLPSTSISEVEELSHSFNTMTQQIQEREQTLQHLNNAYFRFVPIQFLEQLQCETAIEVKLGDCIQTNMAVLFSDIRSFTTLSEGMTPKENFEFLNTYLQHMTPIIREYNGFIDKFVGDAIMALFSNTPDDAVHAAIEMFRALNSYNEKRATLHQSPIHMGIGIHQGATMLGIIGGDNRMESTVISDAVNLAARLEGLTKIYGVSLLISEAMHKSLRRPNNIKTRIIDHVKAKGKTQSVIIYEVYNGDTADIFDKKLSTQKEFEAGVALYHSAEFEKAQKLFESCASIFPEDKATAVYIKRCKHYIKVGWDADWDGICHYS